MSDKMEGINVPYKGLRMRFWEHIRLKARLGRTIYYMNPEYKYYQRFIIQNFKPVLMEWWELELRVALDRKLDGSIHYQIGDPPYVAMVGKQGYINFEVGLNKEVRKFSSIEGDYFY